MVQLSNVRGRPVHRGRRVAARVTTAVAVVVVATLPAMPAAAISPLGDVAAAWPSWTAYENSTGSALTDPTGDVNPGTVDLASGAGTSPTMYWAANATTAFVRLRLASDPTNATMGGLDSEAYVVRVISGGTIRALFGVYGKHPSADYVYVAAGDGDDVTPIYTFPFTAGSAGMRVVPDGAGQFFLDFQVPLARILAASAGALVASTPVQFVAGTTSAANLANVNKDLIGGVPETVPLDGVVVPPVVPAALTTASSATPATGPNPPVAGSASTFTVTLSMANPGGSALSGATAVATLPAGVTFVSSSSPAVGASGTTLTWNAGTLAAAATESVTVTLSFTPTLAMAGTTTGLLSAVAASGTDTATSETRNAAAPALTVAVAAAAPPPPPVNQAPTAADDTLTTAAGVPGAVTVLANDSDPDGDALDVEILSGPAHGTAAVTAGVVTYTPDSGYEGADSLTYRACDPSDACASATVTITVTHVNVAPSAVDDVAGTAFGTAVTLDPSANDTDLESDPLSVDVPTQPANGTVSIDGNDLTYTPDPGFSGVDVVTYVVCDDSEACDTGTVTVTVAPLVVIVPPPPVNAAPVADAGTDLAAAHGASVALDGTASFDPDLDVLSYAWTQTSGAAVVLSGANTATPSFTASGPATLTFELTVSDGVASDTSAVTVVVAAPVVGPGPVLPGPVGPAPQQPAPQQPQDRPATRADVRDRRAARRPAAPDVPALPFTGMPVDAMLATGVMLVAVGTLSIRRGARRGRSTA